MIKGEVAPGFQCRNPADDFSRHSRFFVRGGIPQTIVYGVSLQLFLYLCSTNFLMMFSYLPHYLSISFHVLPLRRCPSAVLFHPIAWLMQPGDIKNGERSFSFQDRFRIRC